MYCVVRGEKHFTLLPPSDVLFLYEQEYAQGRYRRKSEGGGFEVKMEEGTVPWIPVGENGRQHARAGLTEGSAIAPLTKMQLCLYLVWETCELLLTRCIAVEATVRTGW